MDNINDGVIQEDAWVSLAYILDQSRREVKLKVTIALLKEVIETKGVRTHDQWGKLISATDGDERELTSKARVYGFLAKYYAELKACDELPPGVHPDQDPDRWLEYFSPLNEFGWPKGEVPDFAEWIVKSNQMREKKTSTLTRNKNQDDWKIQAVLIAEELFNQDTRNGSRDSLAGYSKRVMEEMQQRGIHGPRGLITNAKTIMRESLQSEQWWKKKKP